jgi:hypothetical protein
MEVNESIICLDISTLDGANRNRMNKKSMASLKKMLTTNKLLEILAMNGINLGNFGM